MRIFLPALLSLSLVAEAGLFKLHDEQFKVGPNPVAVVASDLDGDGLPELITANVGRLESPREEKPANDELSYLKAVAPLEYQTQAPLRTGFAPYAVAAANIDALKAPDILAVSFLAKNNRDLTVFRNLEDRFEKLEFSVPDAGLTYARMVDGDGLPVFTTPGLTALAVADFDGDGFRDVIATGWSADALVYFPGDAEQYFGAAAVTAAPGGPRDVATGDFDGDGDLDLAVSFYTAGQLGLFENVGAGKFEEAARFSTRGHLPNALAVSDVNGDNRLDIVVTHCHADDSVEIFYGDGHFTFSASQELLLDPDREELNHEIRDVLAQDLDGDQRTDILVACHRSQQVVLWRNVSTDASLPQKFREEPIRFKEGRPRGLTATDINQNGRIDVAVTLWETDRVAILLNGGTKQ